MQSAPAIDTTTTGEAQMTLLDAWKRAMYGDMAARQHFIRAITPSAAQPGALLYFAGTRRKAA